MGRRRQYHGVDSDTEYKMVLYEFILVCILLCVGVTAVVLICMGLATDLTSGNRSLEVKVETVPNHTAPIFTFCPVGEDETTRPLVEYCSFAFELSIKSDAPVEREWGENSFPPNCVTDMQNDGLNVWRPHPIDSACWVLEDASNALVPLRGSENMFVVFRAQGIGMRVWNSSDVALAEDPSNSTLAQGVRIVFGAGDLIELTEETFQRLGEPKETSYELNQFGSFPLAALGSENVSIVVITWKTDRVFATQEKETISVLTLVAIITGALAVALDLIFKNFAMLFYQLFIYKYPGDGTGGGGGADKNAANQAYYATVDPGASSGAPVELGTVEL